ncbi:MAG: low molecular weight protein-tyrosine-phosphatase [Woeseiaceae bacterium]
MSDAKIGVLFVCMGNICRSPTAEAVFRSKVEAADLAPIFDIDSAGTHAYHVGHPPDSRSAKVAAAHDINMANQKARRVSDEDYTRFDYIVAMDEMNLLALQEREPEESTTVISLLLSEAEEIDAEEVPDPYYGGAAGFDHVFELVNTACDSLLTSIRQQRGI